MDEHTVRTSSVYSYSTRMHIVCSRTHTQVRGALSSACVYFSLDHPPPVTEPILILNGASYHAGGNGDGNGGGGGGGGVINTVCFPSVVRPSYAPAGRHLASVGIVGAEAASREDLEQARGP